MLNSVEHNTLSNAVGGQLLPYLPGRASLPFRYLAAHSAHAHQKIMPVLYLASKHTDV